jgi:hypothetical protein
MLSSIIFILLASWLGIIALAYIFQDKLIYFPDKQLSLVPSDLGMPFQEVNITTSDQLTLHGWFIPHETSKATVLFMHGNAGNISHRLESVQIFHDMGLSVLIFDYRGYGLSEGRPSEHGTYMDAEAAWQFLVDQQGMQPEEIIVFGRSLGAAIAIWLAERRTPGLLIAESAFTSVAAMAQHLYPYLPARLLTRIHYPSIQRIGNISSPVLIVHSTQDELIPYEFGQLLYNSANQPKSFLQIRGGHNDGFAITGDEYIAGLRQFIQNWNMN